MANNKIKSKIGGELIAVIFLLIVCLWFFLINFDTSEIGMTAIVSGILFLFSLIWGIVSIVRYYKV